MDLKDQLATNFPKFTFEEIPISEIYNDLEQVRKKTAKKNIDVLADAIKAVGQQTPIAVCPSEITKKSKEYEHHLIAGQKRMIAMKQLGYTYIQAKVYEEMGPMDRKIQGFIENYADTPMDTTEVWDNIKDMYFEFDHDVNKVHKRTGIKVTDIKNAVKSERIKDIENGSKLLEHAKQKADFKPDVVDQILEVCLIDLKTLDDKKAVALHDELAKINKIEVRKNILAVAKEETGDSVDQWVKEGKIKKVMKNAGIQFEENELEKIKAYADELGTDWKEFIHDTIVEKVSTGNEVQI
tara:strand:- start:6072 stop:6959 length:888 start_codon:yes stop_codon:yes gene_type:complete